MRLDPISKSLWCLAAPHAYLGMRIGARMTIVRLPNAALWLHSPVALTDELAAEVDALGPVEHIVCPNLFHHMYAGEAQARWPKATLHAPAGLRSKRRDLRIDQELGEAPIPAWGGVFQALTIQGTLLHETAFVHRPSRTLISADLTENFVTSDHLWTRICLKLGGIHGRIGWSRLLRFAYRDHAAARACVDRLLELDFDRIVLSHGGIIESGGREAIRQTFAFLR